MTQVNIDFKIGDYRDVIKQATAEQVYTALDMVGNDAEGYVAMLTPVDTGNLRNSLDHEVGENVVYVGTNVEYAQFVEFNEKARHPSGQAHYLRDGIANNIDSFRSVFEKNLRGGN